MLGLALAFGLATLGHWPAPQQGTGQQALSDLEARIASIEDARETEAAMGGDVSDRMAALESGLEDAAMAISSLSESAPESQFEELDALAQTVSTLSERVDALGAGSDAEQSRQGSSEASALETRLADIETARQETVSRLEGLEQDLAGAQEQLASLEDRIADQSDFDALSAERDRLAQLPDALAALETAIAAGTPFANELAAVGALVPDYAPGEDARATAAQGAASAATLLDQFQDIIPDLIAARPQAANQDWFDTLLDQTAAALALRPSGANGEDPAALIGRTEAALEAGEIEQARDVIARFPLPMAEIAQPVSDGIAANLTARESLAQVREARQAEGAGQ